MSQAGAVIKIILTGLNLTSTIFTLAEQKIFQDKIDKLTKRVTELEAELTKIGTSVNLAWDLFEPVKDTIADTKITFDRIAILSESDLAQVMKNLASDTKELSKEGSLQRIRIPAKREKGAVWLEVLTYSLAAINVGLLSASLVTNVKEYQKLRKASRQVADSHGGASEHPPEAVGLELEPRAGESSVSSESHISNSELSQASHAVNEVNVHQAGPGGSHQVPKKTTLAKVGEVAMALLDVVGIALNIYVAVTLWQSSSKTIDDLNGAIDSIGKEIEKAYNQLKTTAGKVKNLFKDVVVAIDSVKVFVVAAKVQANIAYRSAIRGSPNQRQLKSMIEALTFPELTDAQKTRFNGWGDELDKISKIEDKKERLIEMEKFSAKLKGKGEGDGESKTFVEEFQETWKSACKGISDCHLLFTKTVESLNYSSEALTALLTVRKFALKEDKKKPDVDTLKEIISGSLHRKAEDITDDEIYNMIAVVTDLTEYKGEDMKKYREGLSEEELKKLLTWCDEVMKMKEEQEKKDEEEEKKRHQGD